MRRDQKQSRYAASVPVCGLSDQQFHQVLRVIADNATLLKKAFGADELPVVWLRDCLWFPWFTLMGVDGEEEAYQRLVSRLCRRAGQIPRRKGPAVVTRLAMWRFLTGLGFTDPKDQRAFQFLFDRFSSIR